VLVHHGADVPLEVGEEDAAGADVLGLGGTLLLGAAVLLLDAGRGVAGEGAAGAGAAAALRGFLHLGVKGELLEERGKEGGTTEAVTQGCSAQPAPATFPRGCRGLAPGRPPRSTPRPAASPRPSAARLSHPAEAGEGLQIGPGARNGELPSGAERDSPRAGQARVPRTKPRTRRRFAGRVLGGPAGAEELRGAGRGGGRRGGSAARKICPEEAEEEGKKTARLAASNAFQGKKKNPPTFPWPARSSRYFLQRYSVFTGPRWVGKERARRSSPGASHLPRRRREGPGHRRRDAEGTGDSPGPRHARHAVMSLPS